MKPLFWVDLEMTGLDENTHHIIEVAVVVTDWNFKTLEEYHRVVFQPPAILGLMDDWCRKTHGESGLTAAIPNGTPVAEVEKELLALLDRHYSKTDRVVIVGNSIGNDRRFIDKYFTEFTKRLHYRMIDVTSWKEVFRERFGINFAKRNAHRAVDDIYESIRELQSYLAHVNLQPKAALAEESKTK